MRESPAIEVIDELRKRGGEVRYHDPYVPELVLNTGTLHSVAFTDEELKSADCLVVLTDHSSFDVPRIVRNAKLVVDTRNVTRGLDPQYRDRVLKLGAPAPFGGESQGRAA